MTNQLAASKKMMILLHGPENSGKTTTVKEVAKLLEAKLNIKPTNINSRKLPVEILVGFKINDCCVCCSSAGDVPSRVLEDLKRIKKWLCEVGCCCRIIVCTSRTTQSAAYREAVDWARKNGFTVCYIKKSRAAANVSHGASNAKVASDIVKCIDKFHKAKTRIAK